VLAELGYGMERTLVAVDRFRPEGAAGHESTAAPDSVDRSPIVGPDKAAALVNLSESVG
jgi:hypothetical protein